MFQKVVRQRWLCPQCFCWLLGWSETSEHPSRADGVALGSKEGIRMERVGVASFHDVFLGWLLVNTNYTNLKHI